ncbi:helix-turn-helix domain-containing protein [Methylococcus sp. ANG]|uniref:helix-turn-helix domain-containing protein n=1 Tax=Methylococcus sp. ANG TaxID=3231903 RepID=UPI0034599EFF
MTHLVKGAPFDLDALPDSTLLNDVQAAEAVGVKPTTLSVWRTTGRNNLPYIKCGRLVRYKAGDLKEWLARHSRTHSGEVAA